MRASAAPSHAKIELDSLLDRVMNAIDRLSQKVDRLFEERT